MSVTQSERYRQIAEVLIRHGWSTVAEQVGLRARVPSFAALLHRGHGTGEGGRGRPGRERTRTPAPVRLREALEELGPTFIKLGQMLATREDILPVAYTHELSRLQSGTEPVAFEEIRTIIADQLGDVSALYAEFDEAPLGTASIGQTHRARLHDGAEVVVKVRKPGVAELVDVDLRILEELATVASREWTLARDYDIVTLADAFARTLRAELDFTREAANAEHFARNLADDPLVSIPAVHPDLCTSQVLTEQFAGGMRIDDTEALDRAGVDRPALARGATRTIIHMVLADGFFHADPHPGNLFVREDGRIWLIDFGMVGELDDRLRGDILWLLLALQRDNTDAVMDHLLQIAPPRGTVDRRALRTDVDRLLATLRGKDLADISMLDFFSRLTALLRRHRLQLPGAVSTLLRMLVLTEASAITLDPDFRLGQVLEEVGRSALVDQWGPHALAGRLRHDTERAARIAADLPQRLLALLEDYEARGIEVQLPPEDFEPLVERVEATGDRVVAGITMSALIVGIATVAATGDTRVGRLRDPLMLVGGAAAGVLGAYLAADAGPARSARRFVRRMFR